MSDDGYYYDDEFDEFNDMLYDAVPDPDLADDLAEHAAYSPVWQENPTEELRDFFSDWEYYSDDYFDDDPRLLNDGKVASKKTPQLPKRGRKRKLSEVRDPEQKKKEADALAASLRGTVWKGRSPEPGKLFKMGVETPVALKLNAAIMKSAYTQKRGFGKGKLTHDESWANDMSLADMGLLTRKSTGPVDQNADTQMSPEQGGEEDHLQEDDGDINEDEYRSLSTVREDEEVTKIATHIDTPDHLSRGEAKDTIPVRSANLKSPSRKRRRNSSPLPQFAELSDEVGKAPLPTPDASLESDEADDQVEATHQPKRRKGRPPKDAASEAVKQVVSEKDNKRGRKRKLSASESSIMASTASSRAKRAAVEEAPTKTAAASRPKRTRAK